MHGTDHHNYVHNITLPCIHTYRFTTVMVRYQTVSVFSFTGFYILNNLTPSTQYNVYVRAVRLIGITHKLLGSSSATASAKTLSIKTTKGIYFYS